MFHARKHHYSEDRNLAGAALVHQARSLVVSLFRRVRVMLECSPDVFMHHDDQENDALMQYALLKGLICRVALYRAHNAMSYSAQAGCSNSTLL